MKTTILNATKKLAETISTDLLSRKTRKGNPIFTRVETPNGFEITGVNKEKITEVLFRYVNENGRERFDYDERLLSF